MNKSNNYFMNQLMKFFIISIKKIFKLDIPILKEHCSNQTQQYYTIYTTSSIDIFVKTDYANY